MDKSGSSYVLLDHILDVGKDFDKSVVSGSLKGSLRLLAFTGLFVTYEVETLKTIRENFREGKVLPCHVCR